MQYKIIRADNQLNFEREITRLLNEGWQLFGDLMFYDGCYIREVILEEDDEDEDEDDFDFDENEDDGEDKN